LWQVSQVPAATVAWLYEDGCQAEVRWQVSHEAVAFNPLLWLDGLPVATCELWQVVQAPGLAVPWLKRAPKKVIALV